MSYTSFGSLSLETNITGVLAGTAISYHYDHLHRRTNLSIHTPGSTINHAYSYDSASRLSAVSDGTYNAVYDYLANSPLVSQITYRSNTTTRMTTTKKYDFLNRLVDITSLPSADSPVRFSYQYNDANQRTRRTDSDESYWAYEYDSLGQVTSGKHHWDDGTPVAGQQFEYTYDDIGNRRRTKEGGDASGAGLRTANYSVNNLNQYTQRDVPGGVDVIGIAHASATVTANDQSAYRRGEYYQKALTIANASAPVWQPVTNRAVYNGETNTTTGNLLVPKTLQAFWYDSDGNTLSDFVWTNAWDGENRLTQTENSTDVPSAARAKQVWNFDGEGRWVQRIVYTWNGGVYTPQYTNRFLWKDKLLLAILDHNNAHVMSFQRAFDLTALFDTNGVHFFAYDGNGNVVALVSASAGSISGRYEFTPSGVLLRLTGTPATTNPMRFSGEFSDDLAATVKYLYRDYSASGSRWLSRDPIAERGGANLYAFLSNDPLSSLDSLGLIECPVEEQEVGPEVLKQAHPGLTNPKADTKVDFSPTFGKAVQCNCPTWKRVGYSATCKTVIRYAKPMADTKKTPAGTGGLTVEAHEMVHKSNGQTVYTDVDNEYKASEGKCVSKKCYEAWDAWLYKYYAMKVKYLDWIDAQFDCKDYSPGPSKDSACKAADERAASWAEASAAEHQAFLVYEDACF